MTRSNVLLPRVGVLLTGTESGRLGLQQREVS